MALDAGAGDRTILVARMERERNPEAA